MGQRVIRVNELLKREISQILHTRYRGRTVAITVSEVDTSPNLRKARVYFSVIGGNENRVEAEVFFRQHGREIREEMSKAVVLKYLPHLEFIYDEGIERGARLDAIFEDLGMAPGDRPESPPDDSEFS